MRGDEGRGRSRIPRASRHAPDWSRTEAETCRRTEFESRDALAKRGPGAVSAWWWAGVGRAWPTPRCRATSAPPQGLTFCKTCRAPASRKAAVPRSVIGWDAPLSHDGTYVLARLHEPYPPRLECSCHGAEARGCDARVRSLGRDDGDPSCDAGLLLLDLPLFGGPAGFEVREACLEPRAVSPHRRELALDDGQGLPDLLDGRHGDDQQGSILGCLGTARRDALDVVRMARPRPAWGRTGGAPAHLASAALRTNSCGDRQAGDAIAVGSVAGGRAAIERWACRAPGLRPRAHRSGGASTGGGSGQDQRPATFQRSKLLDRSAPSDNHGAWQCVK